MPNGGHPGRPGRSGNEGVLTRILEDGRSYGSSDESSRLFRGAPQAKGTSGKFIIISAI